MNRQKLLRQVIFYVSLLIIWELVARARIWPSYVFPTPSGVFETIVEGFRNKTFIIAIGVSMRRIVIGYCISIICGGVLGLLMSKYKFIDDTVGGVVLGLQTLPSICWMPLALLWFGLRETAIYFVIIMGALFSITIATESGIKNIQPLYLKAGRTMGARRIALFLHVMLPAAMPSFVVGLKQGWSFAWRSLMAGELLFVSLGLGHLLMMGRELNDMNMVFAVMCIIAFIGIAVDKLVFGRIEANIRRKWGLVKQGS